MAKTINIQFRLPESYAGELSDYAMGYESQAQTAKRLLMEFLDGKHFQESEPTPQAVPAPMPSDLGDFGDRLNKLEQFLWDKNGFVDRHSEVIPFVDSIKTEIGDRLDNIDKHWESAKWMILEAQKKIKSLESDLYHGESLAFKEIRDDIKRLETKIKSPPDTAIMIQKKPLDPVLAETTLDHIQASKEFEKALTTIKKWSVDPNKWPEGWIFDGDKQLWIKIA